VVGKSAAKPSNTLLANPATSNLKVASASPSTMSSSSSLFAEDPELFVQPSGTNSASANSAVAGVKSRYRCSVLLYSSWL